MLNKQAGNVRDTVVKLVSTAVAALLAPDPLLFFSFAAAIIAAHMHWGREGALWVFAGLALFLSLSNSKKS